MTHTAFTWFIRKLRRKVSRIKVSCIQCRELYSHYSSIEFYFLEYSFHLISLNGSFLFSLFFWIPAYFFFFVSFFHATTSKFHHHRYERIVFVKNLFFSLFFLLFEPFFKKKKFFFGTASKLLTNHFYKTKRKRKNYATRRSYRVGTNENNFFFFLLLSFFLYPMYVKLDFDTEFGHVNIRPTDPRNKRMWIFPGRCKKREKDERGKDEKACAFCIHLSSFNHLSGMNLSGSSKNCSLMPKTLESMTTYVWKLFFNR